MTTAGAAPRAPPLESCETGHPARIRKTLNKACGMRERIPVSILAGMALILHRHVPALADLLGPVDLLLERIGAGRSQAFAMCHRLLELLPALFRGPGRPRRAPVEEMSLLPVVEACFDYLARHPGAIAVGRQRRQYSDGYRRFVVNLAGPGGLAEGLTVADLSRASQVPLGTLKEWLSPPPDRGRKAEGRGGPSPRTRRRRTPPPQRTRARMRSAR